MVAQLEHQLRAGKLTLQALWYYVQPPLSGACAARPGCRCCLLPASCWRTVRAGRAASGLGGSPAACVLWLTGCGVAVLPPRSAQAGGQPGG